MVVIGQIQRDEAYENLLLIFADFFKYPERELYEELVSGELDEMIHKLSNLSNYPITTDLRAHTGTYEELVDAYNQCFLGIQSPFAPLVESVYKKWTADESFEVPFKNQKGYLMGDSALHIRHILQELGLEIPPEYEMMPDHLTILLELYAYLNGKGFLKEAKQFRHDHFDWLQELNICLARINGNQPYHTMLTKLQEVLSQEPQEIN